MKKSSAKLYIYYVLSMKTPSQIFKENGFEPLADDIKSAVEAYNSKYLKDKQLVLLEISKSEIKLMLVASSESKTQFNVKDLVYFSRFLHNEKSWDEYTREKGTLFYAKQILPLDACEASSVLSDEFELDPEEYGIYFDDDIDDVFEDNEKYREILDTMSDQQALKILEFLINTKELGSEENKFAKSLDIKEIKKILTKWVAQ